MVWIHLHADICERGAQTETEQLPAHERIEAGARQGIYNPFRILLKFQILWKVPYQLSIEILKQERSAWGANAFHFSYSCLLIRYVFHEESAKHNIKCIGLKWKRQSI